MANQSNAAVRSGPSRAERRRMQRDARKKHHDATQNVAALLRVAEGMRQRGKLDEAGNICAQIVRDHGELPQAHLALGTILEQQDRRDAAYACFKQAVTLAPQDFQAWRRLGRCLYMMKHYDAALIAFRKAVGLKPDHLDTLLFVGRTLHSLERSQEALEAFENTAELFPDSADAHLERGLQLQTLGRFDEAKTAFQHTIAIDPKMVEAHFRLAAMGETSDDLKASLEHLHALGEDNGLTPEKRAGAHFAAAQVLNRQKRARDAFAYYRRGNDLLRDVAAYDREGLSRMVDISIEAFTKDVFENAAEAGAALSPGEPKPVFIVGMPRSGTTLAEQIVSSHRDVAAGGEERKLSELAEALMREEGGSMRYPQDVSRITPKMLKPIADDYRNHMRARLPGAACVTDKNPFNFFHVGLIAMLFPDAAIIHCRREPMDTCVSCYFQYFGDVKSLAFTTDLEDLGHFYGQYRRMVQHWSEVLPGRMLELAYEDVISDQEGMSRRIIDHIGLPWDEACLRFNENDRGVRTASHWQVRQPIYKTSVNRWKQFESELEPLRSALENAA